MEEGIWKLELSTQTHTHSPTPFISGDAFRGGFRTLLTPIIIAPSPLHSNLALHALFLFSSNHFQPSFSNSSPLVAFCHLFRICFCLRFVFMSANFCLFLKPATDIYFFLWQCRSYATR